MVEMPPHIQQMLFDFALERGYIDMILEMYEEEEKEGNEKKEDEQHL
ncbi:TPA: hypothetical protein O8C03_002550 [Staphylococcus aureus]|nr:hypothetical protein [Staphylococcus aureus]